MQGFLTHYAARVTSEIAGLPSLGVWICNAILLVFLLICAYTDGTRHKIYNKVTFPAMALGLLLHFAFGGIELLKFSLLGWAVGMAIQWIPFMLGFAKAGDVKLLAAVGALKGWAFCLSGFLYGAIAFAILTIPLLMMRGEMDGVRRNIRNYFALAFLTQRNPGAPKPTVEKKFVPWGVGLAVGFLIALVLEMGLSKPFWF